MGWAVPEASVSLGGLFSLPLRSLWGFLRGFILLSKLPAESPQRRVPSGECPAEAQGPRSTGSRPLDTGALPAHCSSLGQTAPAQRSASLHPTSGRSLPTCF